VYRGFYINLDRSTERRLVLEQRLKELGLQDRYQRFPAVLGSLWHKPEHRLRAGEVGCFMSHLEVLKACTQDGMHCHVLEDDVLLSAALGPTLQAMMSSSSFDNWDVVVTDTLVPADIPLVRQYRRAYEQFEQGRAKDHIAFRILDGKSSYRAIMASVIYNARSIPKIIEFYEQGVAAGYPVPIDILLRRLVQAGKVRLGILFPFVTSVQFEEVTNTTLEGRHSTDQLRSAAAYSLLRSSFYVERNLQNLNTALDGLTSDDDDPHNQLLGNFYRFALSKRHTTF